MAREQAVENGKTRGGFAARTKKDVRVRFAIDGFPHVPAQVALGSGNAKMIRRYWCGAYRGEEAYGKQLSDHLSKLTCQATLTKVEGRLEKGVDMAVATHLLVNAFHKNFDIAWLVAGDADYTMLVHEAKRYGGIVNGAFFRNGLADELRRSFDEFHAIELTVDSIMLGYPQELAALLKKRTS